MFGILLNCHTFAQDAEYFVKVNTDDGLFEVLTDPIEGVYYVYSGVQALCEESSTYTFINFISGAELISLNLNNGEITNRTVVDLSDFIICKSMYYTSDNETLATLVYDNFVHQYYVAQINPQTGTEYVQLGDYLPATYIFQFSQDCYNAFDDLFYIYSYTTGTLYTYEMDFASIGHQAAITYNFEDALGGPFNMTYHPEQNKIYAMNYIALNGGNPYVLGTIDPMTGIFTSIGEPFEIEMYYYKSTSLDIANNQMIINSYDPIEGSFVHKIDLLDPSINSSILIYPGIEDPGLFGGPNIMNGLYSNEHEKLFAIHWGPGISTTDIVTSDVSDTHLIYPNPNNGSFTLDLDAQHFDFGFQNEHVYLTIFDVSGKEVFASGSLRQNVVNITTNLTPGLYLCRISSNSKLSSIQIIIE